MKILLIFAVLLFIIWILAKLVFALTGMMLHLLWIIALLMLLIWAVAKLKKK